MADNPAQGTQTPQTPGPEAEVKTVEDRMAAVEEVVFELIDRVEKLSKEQATIKKTAGGKPRGLFGDKRKPVPMKDLKTGIVYPSKAALGKALAIEAGGDPGDTMVYYTVIKELKMDDKTARFAEASPEEGQKAREDRQKQIEAEVAAANARMDAERAAATAAATAASKPKPQPQPQQSTVTGKKQPAQPGK